MNVAEWLGGLFSHQPDRTEYLAAAIHQELTLLHMDGTSADLGIQNVAELDAGLIRPIDNNMVAATVKVGDEMQHWTMWYTNDGPLLYVDGILITQPSPNDVIHTQELTLPPSYYQPR